MTTLGPLQSVPKNFHLEKKTTSQTSPPFPKKLPKWPPVKDDSLNGTQKHRSVPTYSPTNDGVPALVDSSKEREKLRKTTEKSWYDPTPCRPAPRPPF